MDTKKALKFLEKFKTAEEAVKLTGKPKEEYLKALDVAYGDKATRAKDMGFGEEVYYHGSPSKKIDKFKTGSPKSGEMYGRGVYMTKDPEEAALYAQTLDQHTGIPLEKKGKVYSLKTSANNPFDINAATDEVTKKNLSKLVTDPDYKKILPQVEDNYNLHTMLQKDAPATEYTEALKNAGKDSVKVDTNVLNVFDPAKVRSTNAAFDPRFKDSDLIMSAKGAEKSIGSKIGDAISAPQRYTMDKIANMLGVKGDAEDSEASAQAIVEKAASLSGLPEGAPLNAAKALGVAGLEVFADPTNLVPVGKIGKGLGMVAKAIPGASAVKAVADKVPNFVADRLKILYNSNKDKWDKAAKGNKGLQATLDKIKGVEPKQDFGKVTVAPEAKPNYGKVTVQQPEVQKNFGNVTVKQEPDGNIIIIDKDGNKKILKGATTIGSK